MAEASKVESFDARMARRRGGAAGIRDLSAASHVAPSLKAPFLSPFGWLIAVALNIALVLVIALSVVVVPPMLSCREQSVRGFFVGDSFQACAIRGISARFRDFDGRIQSIVLGSGT